MSGTTTSGLKPVGIYREMFRQGRGELPSLRESGTNQAVEDRNLVAQYMKAGTPVFDVMGDAADLLDPAKSIPSGPSLVSDGEWIWRVDSVHYLENYSVEIPAEFLSHVRGLNYQPRGGVDVADPRFDAAISAYF